MNELLILVSVIAGFFLGWIGCEIYCWYRDMKERRWH